jgi:hypothetical protein
MPMRVCEFVCLRARLRACMRERAYMGVRVCRPDARAGLSAELPAGPCRRPKSAADRDA